VLRLRFAAHRLLRLAAPWAMHHACSPHGERCDHDFRSLHYAHHLRGRDTPPCCRSQILAALHAVAGLLGERGVTWFAFWGTYLGVERHGGMIPWDRDADLAVLDLDARALLAVLRTEGALPAGYSIARVSRDVVRVTVGARNRNGVDIECWRRAEGNHLRPLGRPAPSFAAADVLPLREASFEGLRLPVPATTRPLDVLYGPSWRTWGHRRDCCLGRPWVHLV